MGAPRACDTPAVAGLRSGRHRWVSKEAPQERQKERRCIEKQLTHSGHGLWQPCVLGSQNVDRALRVLKRLQLPETRFRRVPFSRWLPSSAEAQARQEARVEILNHSQARLPSLPPPRGRHVAGRRQRHSSPCASGEPSRSVAQQRQRQRQRSTDRDPATHSCWTIGTLRHDFVTSDDCGS